MRDPNNRIHTLAAHALALSNSDIAHAVRILSEMTGLSFELAFEAIEAAVDKVKPE